MYSTGSLREDLAIRPIDLRQRGIQRGRLAGTRRTEIPAPSRWAAPPCGGTPAERLRCEAQVVEAELEGAFVEQAHDQFSPSTTGMELTRRSNALSATFTRMRPPCGTRSCAMSIPPHDFEPLDMAIACLRGHLSMKWRMPSMR